MLLDKIREHEDCMTWAVWGAEGAKRLLQTLAPLTNFINVALHETWIVQCCRQTCQGDRVHVVGRSNTTNGADLLSSTHQHTDAQSRQPVGFGESTRNKKIRETTDLIE